MKIIQAYAPTSASEEDELEVFYDNLNEALDRCPTYYTLLIGDFNAKLGRRQDESENPIGNFGYGERNERGDRLLSVLQENGLHSMSSFFNKKTTTKMDMDQPRRKYKKRD